MSQVSVVPSELAALAAQAALLDVEQVAATLKCSTRHVYRLGRRRQDARPRAGRCPGPVVQEVH